MKFFVIALLVAAPAFALVSKEMVDHINSVQSSWTASMDAPSVHYTPEHTKRILGVDVQRLWAHQGGAVLPEKTFTAAQLAAAPESFDPRDKWPQCDTLNDVRDQSDCGSCWAFGAVEFMSDRYCIHKGETVRISAEDMNSCSGAGSCNGGWPTSAVTYWKNTGVVTDECRAYSLPSCDHHVPDSDNPCNQSYPTPPCVKSCVAGSGRDWNTDKHKGKTVYYVSGEKNIMTEISTNGPCEGAFSVYEDFMSYTGGIYHHVSGYLEGGHAIKVFGYGEENGEKYWLITNSWNSKWGEKGFFRIRRGTNECGIESEIYCGMP